SSLAVADTSLAAVEVLLLTLGSSSLCWIRSVAALVPSVPITVPGIIVDDELSAEAFYEECISSWQIVVSRKGRRRVLTADGVAFVPS
ncbi:hypothetical protein, partial [Erythrobacter sp. YJ-T3-07]|uniref:hypothetical protein n=1 Tax=Erythrobacter sp. YJ-T3-07 TaxID=2793063 RepID=UPI001F1CF7A1